MRRWPGQVSRSGLEPVYDGPGWLAGSWRRVRCWAGNGHYRLVVEPAIRVVIHGGGGWIHLDDDLAPGPTALAEEVLLGPALSLALAIRNTWLLHASAARGGGRVLAFIGRSGLGKSTLAAFLHQQPGWQRLADDVLPVRGGPEGLQALPRFPQLKLPLSDQPGAMAPSELPLQAIYLLAAARADAPVVLEPLCGRTAVLALLAHTAAARLFDRRLLEQHLAFCAHVALQTPMRLLRYPRRVEMLSQVQQVLEQDLSCLGPTTT